MIGLIKLARFAVSMFPPRELTSAPAVCATAVEADDDRDDEDPDPPTAPAELPVDPRPPREGKLFPPSNDAMDDVAEMMPPAWLRNDDNIDDVDAARVRARRVAVRGCGA